MTDKKHPSRAIRTIHLAMGTAFAATLSTSGVLANDNPFASQELDGGYMIAGHPEGKCGAMGDKKEKMKQSMEGKCGEGKCGGAMMGGAGKKEGHSEADHDKKKADMKQPMEGKCGEGKCGGNMMKK